MDVSNAAYKENSALTDEASKRYETFNAQLSQTKEMATNVGIQFGEIMMPYIQKLLEKIQGLVEWFGNLDSGTQEFIVKAAAIAAAIGPILSVVGKIVSFGGTISKVIGVVLKIIPVVTSALSGIGAVIGGTILPALGAAAAAIAPFLPIIAAVAAAIAAVIVVIKNWATITDFISEKWNALTSFLGEATSNIQTFFSEHLGIIGDMIALRIEVIKTIITTTVNIIKILIQTFGQVIQAMIDGDWSKIGTILKNAWEKIKQTIADGVKNIVDKVKGMGDKVKQSFDNLINSAMEWGSHFVQNFCDGITSKMQALIDKVKSMADTVRSYLHFSTGPDIGPLKDFNSWPRHMMQNYAEGIDAARYLVKNAVSDVAADVAVLGNPMDYAAMYDAVRTGASDANVSFSIGEREFTRALRDMGVAF